MNYNELDEGIREVVVALHEQGFKTTDSGDGSKYGNMEGALPYRHVVCITTRNALLDEAGRLQELWPDWHVEASYDPANKISIIMLIEDHDDFYG